MKVIAFAASSSTQSINKKLVSYAATMLDGAEVEILDLNDFEMPLFSQDREKVLGHHPIAQQFLDKISAADALLISFAEHNGAYSAAYKNLFDWCSRIKAKVYEGKPVVLLSTSPGAAGGRNVMSAALGSMPFFGATIKASLSVPSFNINFDLEKNELRDPEWQARLKEAVNALQA